MGGVLIVFLTSGDFVRTLDFTYYLAKNLDTVKSNKSLEHSYVEQTITSNIVDHLTHLLDGNSERSN